MVKTERRSVYSLGELNTDDLTGLDNTIGECKVKKSAEPQVEWKVKLPVSLAARVEHRLIDPVKRKPGYGLRTKLIAELLQAWIARNPAPIDAPSLTEEDIVRTAHDEATA